MSGEEVTSPKVIESLELYRQVSRSVTLQFNYSDDLGTVCVLSLFFILFFNENEGFSSCS